VPDGVGSLRVGDADHQVDPLQRVLKARARRGS
jgi:hypothetical protein